jgi:NADH dehydrogenase
MRVLVLGGAGFIGRHTTAALLQAGHSVTVGSRHPAGASKRLPPQALHCERRRVRFEILLEPSPWAPLLADVDIVVNCVGILRPRWGETYEQVHHRAVAALADACVLGGVRRLIHVSALGLHEGGSSGFLRSKLHAEQALRTRRLDVVIARPSLLDGEDGFGARWLRRASRWPVHFVPSDTTGRIAPLHVRDLAEALCALCAIEPQIGTREVELGGADSRTMTEHLAALRRAAGLPMAHVINVPRPLARVVSHVCDVFHVTPFSFGHLELLSRDNVPATNALPLLLHRAPRWVGVREPRPRPTQGAPVLA